MRYIVKLSYDGTNLCGWQIQRESPSVQEALQHCLSMLLKEDIRITGAGRTDTGVNAVGYVAHFDCGNPIPEDRTGNFCYKLNAILPDCITVHSIERTDEGFHARFSAVSREYQYFIHRIKDPFIERFSWQYNRPLDIGKMNSAAGLLLGTHDFSCFEKTGGNNVTSICTVFEAGWSTWTPSHTEMMDFPHKEGDYLVFSIRADRFLRNMVRATVGSLLEVGLGKKEPGWISELIASGDRCLAGESVPGHALFLSRIGY